MLLFVGLGNPGSEYQDTRHNIGFMAIDALAQHGNFPAFSSKYQALLSEGRIAGQKVVLFKPQTFMNRSGVSVAQIVQFYKIPAQDVYVFYDEMALALGKIRVKQGGSSAGHNGIRSLDAHMSADYWRVRLGIGHPGDKARVTGYVLGAFSAQERGLRDLVLEQLCKHSALLAERKANDFTAQVMQALPKTNAQEEP